MVVRARSNSVPSTPSPFDITYPKEGKVILFATPGVKRSEDKRLGEICTSLLPEL